MKRILLAALVGVVASAHAGPRSYAVVSLFGDRLTVVRHEPQTGSHIDRSQRQVLQMPDTAFDDAALVAAEDALKRSEPGTVVSLLGLSSPALFEDQERFFDGNRVRLPEMLSAALRREGATHLVLITKLRAEAKLQIAYEKVGEGRLEGVGFYIDHSFGLTNRTTGQSAPGFLAPYFYARLSLIDLGTSALLRERDIRGNRVLATASQDDVVNAWNLLTPQQKVQSLRELIRDELADEIPLLLSQP